MQNTEKNYNKIMTEQNRKKVQNIKVQNIKYKMYLQINTIK